MHSLVTNRLHVIFSTKERRNLIPEDLQPRLWAFIGGVARKNGFAAIAVGGTANHAHALIAVPANMPLAKAVQLIKGGSSKFINDKLGGTFAWQEGYAAFSVSASHADAVVAYINNQKEHHAKRSFEDEFIIFLRRNGISFEPGEILGSDQPSYRTAHAAP